jgi:putative transposase
MHEPLRFQGRPLSVTVSRTADRWFASVVVEFEHQVPDRENQAAIGVDLGVSVLATMSDGQAVEGPKALRLNLKRLQRLSRSLSRKTEGSANREKAKRKLGRLHARIANIRNDSLHKLTTDLVKNFTVIGIEDLKVGNLMQNRRASRALSDMGLYEFRRQLTYKAAMTGTTIVVADRFFPSSKTCSECSYVLPELPWATKQWTCPACGSNHERDLNAARNLEKLAVSSTAAACGAGGSGGGFAPVVKLSAMKQEPGARHASATRRTRNRRGPDRTWFHENRPGSRARSSSRKTARVRSGFGFTKFRRGPERLRVDGIRPACASDRLPTKSVEVQRGVHQRNRSR